MKTITTLPAEKIAAELKNVPTWSSHPKAITRTYKFESFLMSIAFVRRVAKHAEKLNHVPDIDIRYDQVTLTNTTHDAGGITQKDFDLAEKCDEVFAKILET